MTNTEREGLRAGRAGVRTGAVAGGEGACAILTTMVCDRVARPDGTQVSAAGDGGTPQCTRARTPCTHRSHRTHTHTTNVSWRCVHSRCLWRWGQRRAAPECARWPGDHPWPRSGERFGRSARWVIRGELCALCAPRAGGQRALCLYPRDARPSPPTTRSAPSGQRRIEKPSGAPCGRSVRTRAVT